MVECTVIIVNWNSWEYLFPCLDALYTQTFRSFNTIVVDNGSNSTEQSLRLKEYANLQYIENKENRGFAAANNQAVSYATNCEWVVLLNPDTLPQKDWLERLYEATIENPNFSFFGSLLLMASDPTVIDGTGDIYHMSGLCWRAGHGLDVSSVPEAPVEIFSPCAAAAMYRRKDFLASGGFDEDFFCYIEDVDLGFRLRLVGHRALFVPDSVVLHHGSATTSVRSDFSVYHGHRNLVWTWCKNMPPLLLLLFLTIHILYGFTCVVLYLKRGRGRVILRAKWDAIKGLPRMLAKRKVVQSNLRISLSTLWGSINKSVIIGKPGKHVRK